MPVELVKGQNGFVIISPNSIHTGRIQNLCPTCHFGQEGVTDRSRICMKINASNGRAYIIAEATEDQVKKLAMRAPCEPKLRESNPLKPSAS